MGVLGDLLPTAIGVALSPVPIIAVVLMLATPRGRANGVAFAVGWVLGLVAVSVAVLLLASGADTSSSASDTVSWGKVVLGVVLLALAVRSWRTRPRAGAEAELPGWMSKLDTFTPVRSLVLGAALSGVNPKNLALTAAAAASIAQAGIAGGPTAVAVAVFVVLGSLTVAGPVVVALAARDKSAAALSALRQFMSQHNTAIMMVVLVVFGAKLVGDGLGVLG